MQPPRLVIQLQQINPRYGGINIGRYGAQCHAISQDEVVIHGGFNKSYLSDTILLNVKENDAIKLPFSPFNHPSARRGHSLCKIKDNLYLFGGDASGQSQDDCFCFVPLQKQWIQIHSSKIRPLQRYSHSVIVKQSKFIVFGGKNPSLKQLFDDSWYFDCTNNQWNYLTHIGLSPSARYGAMVINYVPETPTDIPVNPQKIIQNEGESLDFFLFGGVGQAGRLNDLWRGIVDFNAGTIKWVCVFEHGTQGLPTPRADGSVLQLDKEKAILFGGHGQNDPLEDLWLIDISPIQQSTQTRSPSAYAEQRQQPVDVRPGNVFKLLSAGVIQLRARSQACTTQLSVQNLNNVMSKQFLKPENLILNHLYANPSNFNRNLNNSGVGVDPLPIDDSKLYNVKSHKFFISGGLAGRDALGDSFILEVIECWQIDQKQQRISPNNISNPQFQDLSNKNQDQPYHNLLPQQINTYKSPYTASNQPKTNYPAFDDEDLFLGDIKHDQPKIEKITTNNELLNVLDYKPQTVQETKTFEKSPQQLPQQGTQNITYQSPQKQLGSPSVMQGNNKMHENLTNNNISQDQKITPSLEQNTQQNTTPVDVLNHLQSSRAKSADHLRQSGLRSSTSGQKIPKELVDFQKNSLLMFQQLEGKIAKMQEQHQNQLTKLQQDLHEKNKIIAQLKTQTEIHEQQNKYLTDRLDKAESIVIKLSVKTGIGQDELGIPIGSLLQSTMKNSTFTSEINDESALNLSNVLDAEGKIDIEKLEEKLQNK